MRFVVVRMRESGVVVDRRDLSRREAIAGDLRIEHHADPELGRPVRVARLLSVTQTMSPDLLPALTDVIIVGMATAGFTLAGFERIGSQAFQQSWWVRLPAEMR